MSLQVREYGLEVVCAYMGHIQSCAEVAVREMLRYYMPYLFCDGIHSSSY